MLEFEYWNATCADGTVIRVKIRLEFGKRLRAEWELHQNLPLAGHVDSPLITSRNMTPQLRERAIRALLGMCKGPMKTQGFNVSTFAPCPV